MNKKISVSLAITIAIIAMTVTFSVTMILARQLFDQTIPSVKEKESMYSKLSEIDKYVRANYYGDIQDTTLNDMIAYGYVLGIGDKNASYYSAKQYAELLDIQNGNLLGIGVDVVKDSSGYARITEVYAGSPAKELSLEVGGFITAIDGAEVKGMTRDNVVAKLRGEAGTEVTVSYMAPDSTTSDFTVNRSKYVIPSVTWQQLEEGYGYVRILRFDSTTLTQFSRAVNELQDQGVKALVFDVRDNAGGLLSAAVDCIDMLAPKGDLVYAEYKTGDRKLLGESDDSSISLPMVVLVNKGTASSAELFAASLRQYNGAQLVGANTMGKGTIQAEPYRMSDGSAVVITVAKMLTGTGESFDGTGLSVDVEAAQKADAEGGELTLENDVQLQKALGTAKTLTGGGTGGSGSGTGAGSSSGEAGSGSAGGESGASGEGEDASASAAGEPASSSEG